MKEEYGGSDSNRDAGITLTATLNENDPNPNPNTALDDPNNTNRLAINTERNSVTNPEDEIFILPMSTKSSLDHATSPNHVHDDDDEDTNVDLLSPLVSKDESHSNDLIRSRRRSGDETNTILSLNTTLTPILSNPNSISSDSNCNSSKNNSKNHNHNPFSTAAASASIGTSSTTGRGKERIRKCCSLANEIRRNILRNTITFMNFLARVLFWVSLVVTALGVIWYSRELALHGTDVHLIAWFSAGAFVILGFPISIYGILMHLTNYYQPNIQCYVVRILWMVPIYSIESWLCLRFHEVAIYIETLRDCYESFVLYCFLQFLIEVLGGEESLIMMLKDKSPTRGVHYSPLNWCMKPWVMGQPVSRTDPITGQRTVQWTSPFFKFCKLGCLQYVLLKLFCSIFVMVLEHLNLYKEGDFTPKGGYLYICILTNLSQCWALYCLIFFYYATKNELGPIRPVGKFLAVKSLVFFTWWQALGISMLHQMNLIPSYDKGEWTSEEVAKGLQAYLICIEMFVAAILHIFVFPHTDYLKPLAISTPGSGVSHFKGRRVGRRFNAKKAHGGFKDDRSICSKTSDAPSSMYDLENGSTRLHSPPMKTNDLNEERMPLPEDSDASKERTGFVRALIDVALPSDVMDNTVGIARGDFTVERKTLLYHAAASDQYSLFAKRRKATSKNRRDSSDGDVELK